MSSTIPVSVTRCIEIDVDVPLSDIMEEIDTEDLRAELAKRGDIPDESHEALIERAYQDALHATSLPQSIRDLLWHVHGRAIA